MRRDKYLEGVLKCRAMVQLKALLSEKLNMVPGQRSTVDPLYHYHVVGYISRMYNFFV